MLITKKPEVSEKELLLGDYVTVHVTEIKNSEVNSDEKRGMKVCRESFVQRARKERGELFQRVQKQSGTLIDVRQRGAA